MKLYSNFKLHIFYTAFLFCLIFFLTQKHYINAFDPNLPNNKYGIHFALPNLDDLVKAKELINSNGGDWGYVTLVIPENDRDKNKWQEVFDRMRELHLIPIIRLATVPQDAKWRRPAAEDADAWANFLDSLNWVVKDRYVILFNEPNHGAEWGGSVDADNYADIALTFARKLKEKNQDYFIMLAGLDASAPNSPPQFQDESVFLSQVFNNKTIEQWNKLLSGFASHSYPNPDFSGSPYNSGRGSIRSYEWELNFLKQLGVKELPVFITETGWRRGDESSIADYLKAAYGEVWLPDDRVVAVTPFVFDYQGEPFLNFSWKKYQNEDFYPQYYAVQSLTKVSGMPKQIEKGVIEFDFPKELVTQSSYRFSVKLRNLGQAVWDKDFGYQISVIDQDEKNLEFFTSDLKRVKPFAETELDLYLKTSNLLGKGKVQTVLSKFGQTVIDGGFWEFETYPLPSLNFQASLFPKFQSAGEDFELQIFNNREEIVFKKKSVKVKDDKGLIEEVQNVALGRKYRVVLLKPYYLPRQVFVTFAKGVNSVLFERMLPLDFSPNGKLELADFTTLIQNPQLINLLSP